MVNNNKVQSFVNLDMDGVMRFEECRIHDYLPFAILLNRMVVAMDHKIDLSKTEKVLVTLFVVVNTNSHMVDIITVVDLHIT